MDPLEEWRHAQQRVLALVEPLDEAAAEIRVPACPDWTVRNLFSHMVGLGVDVLAGDEPDDHNPTWTQRQVEARADHDVATIAAEWRGITEPLVDWMSVNGPRPLGDVIIHEQDLRGALGVSGGQDSPGFLAIRDRFLGRVADAVDGLPPIALVADGWQWVSGGGTVDEAAVVLRAGEADLARALVSRRSQAQVRSWTERGDVGPYLPAFSLLGSLPEHDLHE